MSYNDASPLATLCTKAGSTLDEILALDEKELDELSKEIVGNGVLEHARVVKQWRRCRLEALVRKEVEEELVHVEEEDVGEEVVPEEEVVQVDPRQEHEAAYNKQELADTLEREKEAMGQDWQAYLRRQIRQEMYDSEPATSHAVDSHTGVPSVIEAATTSMSRYSDEDRSLGSFEGDQSTWYSVGDKAGSIYDGVQAVASDVFSIFDDGMKAFFNAPETEEKRRYDREKRRAKKRAEELAKKQKELEAKEAALKKKEMFDDLLIEAQPKKSTGLLRGKFAC